MKLLLFAATLLTVGTAMAEDAIDSRTREGTEWAILRWQQAPNTKLPRVLLVGDSITNGYAGHVTGLLKDRANVDFLATSKSVCDPAFLLELTLATDGYKHAVIHFNNGLHGWHLSDEQYEAGLRRMVAKLRELSPQAKLVWGSCTSAVTLPDKQLDPKANATVLRRNEVAARVMTDLAIPIDDLYAAIVDHCDWHSDSLHFNQEGYAALAASVVNAVSPLLP
ncbi:MAG: SGNH/GDSL hydrolase family protein, partial [Armatimonadetes bacterium]|nr:SGNH/GDSL hydrolase family protein [Armatimonadota bacterium]